MLCAEYISRHKRPGLTKKTYLALGLKSLVSAARFAYNISMNKYFFSLLCAGLTLPVFCAPQTALEQNLAAKVQQARPGNETVLPWNRFEQLTQETARRNQREAAAFSRQTDQILNTYSDQEFNLLKKEGVMFFKNTSAADYAALFGKAKLIFVGENHDSPQVTAQVQQLIRQYRKANPNARILWASEFALRTADGKNSLQKAKAPQEPHLVFINETQMQQVRAAGADILALDDYIFQEKNGNLSYKVNDTWVNVLPAPKALAADWQKAVASGDEEQMDRVVKQAAFITDNSAWGAEERNKAWARKIQAVQNNYDVIFVHAGMAHLDDTLPVTVPNLLKKPYVSVNLLGLDVTLTDEQKAFYQKADDVSVQDNLHADKTREVNQIFNQTPQILRAYVKTRPGEFLLGTPNPRAKKLMLAPLCGNQILLVFPSNK